MEGTALRTRTPLAPADADHAAARRALRGQIAHLERQLADAVADGFRHGLAHAAPEPAPHHRRPAARLLDLGELEAVRDRLAARLHDARQALAERHAREEQARVRLERMLLEPGRHRFERVAARELGEAGCGVYHVRPRLGLIGMLAGWWHVKLSSGCPLPSPPTRSAV